MNNKENNIEMFPNFIVKNYVKNKEQNSDDSVNIPNIKNTNNIKQFVGCKHFKYNYICDKCKNDSRISLESFDESNKKIKNDV